MSETRSRQNNDDYLWDRSGEPDPDIERLERLLAPFAHDGRALRSANRRGRRWVGFLFLAAAVLATATVVVWYQVEPPDQLELIVTSDNTRLRRGATFQSTKDEELLLQESFGRLEDPVERRLTPSLLRRTNRRSAGARALGSPGRPPRVVRVRRIRCRHLGFTPP